MIEILHCYTRAVLYRSEDVSDLRAAVVAAVTSHADLQGAYLRGVNLQDADLRGVNLGDAMATETHERAMLLAQCDRLRAALYLAAETLEISEVWCVMKTQVGTEPLAAARAALARTEEKP